MPDFQPLLGYADYNFKHDHDLDLLEKTMTHPFDGVDVFEENGKTVFGFWLIIDPQKKGSVTLTYNTLSHTADGYQLLWQKQSGTPAFPIYFSFQSPSGKQIASKSDNLQSLNSFLIFNSDLSMDQEVKIGLK